MSEACMSWNYRVLDHGTHLAVHQVYCHDDGSVMDWEPEAATFSTDPQLGVADIVLSLERALSDTRRRGVLRVVDLPG